MGWIIFADILLIIIAALCLSVTVTVRIDEDIRIKVKYAGITIFSVSPEDEAKKKAKKKNKNSKHSVKQADADTEKNDGKVVKNKTDSTADKISAENVNDKNSGKDGKSQKAKTKSKSGNLSDNWEMIKTLIESAGRPVKRLISHIRVTDLFADITVSGEDAASAALNYGKINWLVHSAIAFLYQTVRLCVKKINIGVDFTSGNTEYFISCKIKMRLCTAIGCALWFIARAAKLTMKKTQSDITGKQKVTLKQNAAPEHGVPHTAKKGI